MINLLKKDLRVSFNGDIKLIIKLLVGLTIFTFILAPVTPLAVPLFVSYIFIYRSFSIDERNNCDYFINSLPVEKDDIVYSKYVFSLIVIIGSLIFTYAYSKVIESIWMATLFNFQSIMYSLNIILILYAVTLPIVFKYGYNKSYIIVNLLLGVMLVLIMIIQAKLPPVVTIHPIDGYISENIYDNSKLFMINIGCIVSYLISMYVSKTLYTKKETAN